MEPWVSFACPEDACKALQAVPAICERLGKLAARPWNPYEPRETHWWLVPQDERGDWPAYHLGKYAFEFGDEHDTLDIALFVEKGVSKEAATTLGVGQSVIVTDDWMWWRFLRDLRSRRVTDRIRHIARTTGLDVTPYFVVGPLLSPGSPRVDREVISVALGNDGQLAVQPEPKLSRHLKSFRSVATDAALASALAGVDGFTWVDAYVGATFRCSDRLRTENVWTTDRIWETFLSRFAEWTGA
jgi:hypothetical protein